MELEGKGTRRLQIAIAVCLGVGSVLGCGGALPRSDPHPDLGRAPPPVVANALDGTSIDLPSQGHVTVIDLWATWCKPCRESMPGVERLWHDGRSAGIRVVGIATDDNPGLVANAVRREDLTYPNVVDASGEVRGWLRVRELPTIVVFDRRGRIRWVHSGATDEDGATLGAVVASLEHERD